MSNNDNAHLKRGAMTAIAGPDIEDRPSTDRTSYPRDELTRYQLDLLTTVSRLTASGSSPSGLELKADLESAYGVETNHGRLYPNLDTLVDKGLVQKGVADERTNTYDLTPDGARALLDYHDWLSSAITTGGPDE